MSIYGSFGSPRREAMTADDFWQSAYDQPLSLASTFFDQVQGGALESYGLGTAIKDFTIPEGEPTTADNIRSALRFANPMTMGYEVSRRTAQALMSDSPALTEEQYKASPSYRESIPWDAGMTEARAAALAQYRDAKEVRDFYAQKRPITAFLGNITGQALDPINYVPVTGQAVRLAQTARFGRIAGEAVTGALDAAGNTALFGLATRDQRAKYGDDVSFETMVTDIAMAALIGGAFGTLSGALGKRVDAKVASRAQERLSTLKNVQESRIALNEAIDAVVRGEDVALGPNATAPVERIAAQVDVLGRTQEPVAPAAFYRQPHKAIDDLYTVAPAHQSALDDIGRSISSDIDGVEFKTAGIKDKATAAAKIARKGYDGADRLTDVIRGGFIVDRMDAAEEVLARLAQSHDILDEGWIKTEAGYIDRKALIRFPDGTVGEVQIWDRSMLNAKKAGGGHALYKKYRDLPFGSPEAIKIQDEMIALYSAASARSPGDWSSVGGVSSPKLLNRSRQASSVMTPAVSNTSQASTLTQGELGLSMAKASELPRTAGRLSQLTNRIGGSFSRSVDTSTPARESPPDGLAEATARVGSADSNKALAEQFGVDPKTGEFAELEDIEALRALGRLTAEDEAALAAADQTMEAAEAYGNTLKAALHCII